MKFYLYICMTFPSQPNSEKFYVIIYCSYSIKYVLAVENHWGFFLIDHLYESVMYSTSQKLDTRIHSWGFHYNLNSRKVGTMFKFE